MIHNPQKAQTNIYSLHLLMCSNNQPVKSEDWPKTFEIQIHDICRLASGVVKNCELNSTFNSDKEGLILYYWWGLLSNDCEIKSNTLTHRLKWDPSLVLQNIIHVSTVPKSRSKTGLSANPVCPGLENVWCIVKCENATGVLTVQHLNLFNSKELVWTTYGDQRTALIVTLSSLSTL